VMMGGRVAEELYLKKVTTGAGNDLEQATDMARRMVCEWGMSETMGPLTFGKKEEQIFLGREIAQHQDYSESTASLIDKEVKRLVLEGYERARDILSTSADTLHRIARALLEYEVLNGEEVLRAMRGEEIAPQRERRPRRPSPETPTRPEPERARDGRGEAPVISTDPLKQPG
ncbi:MAG TPA: cell division protein FtsH, partial [Candidatus Polarisedimenticolia bacterium]|nr:cell division protein FtsH [Candidatus Polarisedimenticolia bacterium]